MRHLLLLRHAKSSWDDARLPDHDRPLAPRGVRAAEAMGAEIARRNWVPGHAIVSTATRTRDTWRIASADWNGAPPADFRGDIYEAPPRAILDAIRRTPEDVATLLVVGHNPGLEDLSDMLAGSGSHPRPLADLRGKFPTGALARFGLASTWRDLAPGGAILTHFLTPRSLAREA